MIYAVLEQDGNVINPVEKEFVSKFHKSAVKRVGKDGCAGQRRIKKAGVMGV